MKRRVLAVVMSLLVVMAFMPAGAYADDTASGITTEAELIAALEAGGEINLDGDITVTQALTAKKDITINGGSHTLTRGDEFTGDMLSIEGCTAIIEGVTFDGNNIEGSGQLLDLDDEANAIVAANFQNNVVKTGATNNGGAIYVHEGSKFAAIESNFTGNTANDNGGALYLQRAESYLEDCIFENNTANATNTDNHYGAGAVYEGGGTLDVKDCLFKDNNSGYHGGAMTVYAQGHARIANTAFDGNEAPLMYGGAILLNKSHIDAYGCDFTNNSAKQGGAIHFYSADNCPASNLVNCKFESNSSTKQGGAIVAKVAEGVKIFDSTFRANSGSQGGAIEFEAEADGYIYNSSFEDNSATSGGAIYAAGEDSAKAPKYKVFGSEFISNSATGNGGAMYVYTNSKATIQDCDYIENSVASGKYGGAIYQSGSSVLTILDNTAESNTAGSGGFIYATVGGSTLNIDGLKVKGNTGTGSVFFVNSALSFNVDKTSVVDKDTEEAVVWDDVIMTKTEVTPKYGDYEGAKEEVPSSPASPAAKISIADIPDQAFTGEAVTPELNVTGAETYDAIYSENVELGKGKVAVIAKGNKMGFAFAEFNIKHFNSTVTIGDEVINCESLAEAFAAVPDGEQATIKLLEDSVSSGISVPAGKNIVLDLNEKTLTFDKPGAGSNGTKTQGFQLLQGSTFEFKNGTIAIAESNKDMTWAKEDTEKGIAMLIQNYADLKLTDVELDGTNIAHNGDNVRYILSNNSGDVALEGNTSIMAPAGDFAFDACKSGSYEVPSVKVNTTGQIVGNVELAGGKLTIEYGGFTGEFVEAENYADGQVAIKGGVYKKDVNKYCVEGFSMYQDENGNFIVKENGDVVKVLEEKVAVLEAEIEALEQTKAENEELIAGLKSEVTDLYAQIDQLKDDYAALEEASKKEAEAAKEEAEKAQAEAALTIAKLEAKVKLLDNPIKVTTKISGTSTKATVTVSWNEIEGASYLINGVETTETSMAFSETRGVNKTYKVQAFITVGDEQILGKEVSKTAKPAPLKVSVSSAKNIKTKKIKTSWKKIAGAKYYQVSVATSKSKTTYATKKTTKLSYTKSNLKKGKYYYVKVRAVGANGTYGAWSTVKKIKVTK